MRGMDWLRDLKPVRWLLRNLTKYRIVERMDRDGEPYYMIECRYPFGLWKPRRIKTHSDRCVGTVKYDVTDEWVRFRNLEDAKDMIGRLVESREYLGVMIEPLVYVSNGVWFETVEWFIYVDKYDNLDGYFDFATHSYKTMEETEYALDKWIEERKEEARREDVRKKYKRVVYRY